MYQQSALGLAPDPKTFQERMQDVARRLLQHGNHSPRMKAFLRDVARGRYPFKSLATLIAASAACPDVPASIALADEIRGVIVSKSVRPRATFTEALEYETMTNGRENLAELRFLTTRTDVRKRELIESLNAQAEASVLLADCLHAAETFTPLALAR